MPVSAYFKGDGKAVMAALVKRYGKEKGHRMFYALAAKQKRYGAR